MTSEDKTPSPPRRSPMSWRRRTLFTFIVLLIATVVLDVVVGVVMCSEGKFLNWPLPPYEIFSDWEVRENAKRSRRGAISFHREYGWTMRPTRTGDRNEFINEQGARSKRDYASKPPAGVRRVVAFGDSFVFGSEVEDADVWSSVLEEKTDALEVLNLGINGYGPDQAWRRYQIEGAALAPDVVLIGLMLENINRVVSTYRHAYALRTPVPLVKPRYRVVDGALQHVAPPVASVDELLTTLDDGSLRTEVEQTDYWMMNAPGLFSDSVLYRSSFYRILRAAQAHRQRTNYRRFYKDQESEPYRVMRAVITAFAQEVEADGAEPIVLVFPDKQSLEHAQGKSDATTWYWGPLLDDLRADGIAVLDLTPNLLELAAKDGLDGVFKHVHYNAAGNEVVADAVIAELAQGH